MSAETYSRTGYQITANPYIFLKQEQGETASDYWLRFLENSIKLGLQRCAKSLLVFPSLRGWIETLLLTLAVMIPGYILSVAGDWYKRPPLELNEWPLAFLGAFFVPALSEELVCRSCLVPHRSEEVTTRWRLNVILGALVFYVVIHPINGLIQGGFMGELFTRWDYILLVTLLGIACHISYQRTGSVWSTTLIHALVVTAWIIMRG